MQNGNLQCSIFSQKTSATEQLLIDNKPTICGSKMEDGWIQHAPRANKCSAESPIMFVIEREKPEQREIHIAFCCYSEIFYIQLAVAAYFQNCSRTYVQHVEINGTSKGKTTVPYQYTKCDCKHMCLLSKPNFMCNCSDMAFQRTAVQNAAFWHRTPHSTTDCHRVQPKQHVPTSDHKQLVQHFVHSIREEVWYVHFVNAVLHQTSPCLLTVRESNN